MATEIKNIPIANILSTRYNLMPTRCNGNRLTYLASWRGDHKPSLSVYQDTNRWMDHGTGKHGSNVDLIMEIENFSYGEAADILKDMEGMEPVTFSSKSDISSSEKPSTIEVIKDELITDPKDPCFRYLAGRGLTDPDVWWWYIRKVTYRNGDNTFWGLGWQDEQKHWHLRSLKDFKGCTGQGVTNIRGTSDSWEKLLVLEGIIDYFSLITMYPDYQQWNAVILNSLANAGRTFPDIPEYGLLTWQFEDYREICLLLDRDEAGSKITTELMAFVPRSGLQPDIKDCRGWYSDSNDINEHLQKKLGLWKG